MPGANALDVLRPFLWLALAAFLTGFFSYLALGEQAPARTHVAPAPRVAATASAPDAWNLPKHI
jgi:hypothetical protein